MVASKIFSTNTCPSLSLLISASFRAVISLIIHQVFQRLLNTNLVPAIIVPLNFPFRRAFAALSRVVPAESFTKEITCRGMCKSKSWRDAVWTEGNDHAEDFIPQCSTYYDMKPQQIRCAHDLLLTKQKLLCHNTKVCHLATTEWLSLCTYHSCLILTNTVSRHAVNSHTSPPHRQRQQ